MRNANWRKVSVRAIKSKIITPDDDLLEVLRNTLKSGSINEADILAVSSKVVAVTQGRIAKISSENEFKKLVESEADKVLGGKEVTLTVKNNIFTPWAGIDRSNTRKGMVVLWPRNAYKAAQEILDWLKKTYQIKKAGVVMVDSFCAPLRKGVIGVALAHAGFEGVNDRRGTKDLYGNTLKVTQEAVADSLATMANLVMGQGSERTPFAIISNAPVRFITKKTAPRDLVMPAESCLYGTLLKGKL